MTPKQYTFRYRTRNWPDYNRALIARGRLTFWFDEEAVLAWRNTDPRSGRGVPQWGICRMRGLSRLISGPPLRAKTQHGQKFRKRLKVLVTGFCRIRRFRFLDEPFSRPS